MESENRWNVVCFIILFLVLLIFALFSCSNPAGAGTITSIESSCEKYPCSNCLHSLNNGGQFWDSCGKFKVGDKIKIIKNE